MIRNLKFRSKLILLVALPLCALVAVTVPGLTGRLSVVRAETRAQKLQAPSAALTQLVQALDNENALSDWYVAGGDSRVQAQLKSARAQTDHEIAAVRPFVEELRSANAGAAADGVTKLLARLQRLSKVRQGVDSHATQLDGLNAYFQDSVDQVLAVVDAMGAALRDPNEVANLRDFASVLRLAAATGQERAIVTGGFAPGLLSQALAQQVAGAVAAQDAYRASFEGQASPALRAAFENRIRSGGAVADRVHALRTDVLAGRLADDPTAAQNWYEASTQQTEMLFAAAHGVLSQSDQFGTARKSTAQHEMFLYGAGALGALLVALGLALVIGRSATRSLRRLTVAADDMTEHQLPQLLDTLRTGGVPAEAERPAAIPVESRDEIGALARAFNAMEQTVVEVAQEQSVLLQRGVSDLYVNLARRNQSLLDRQIRMIDKLERDEVDPDRLGALFGVDHLATRMRRNAESLLVLASAESARHWGEDVSLHDVVRSAASEISDYGRVDVVGLDDTVRVTRNAVIDVTHLLAELLENATSFSPPDSRVVVSGRWEESSFMVAIVDDGIGITGERLEAANRLLQEPPAPGLALSRSLGLIVVSHLAARTGVAVELRSGEQGTVALATLPASVLAGSGSPASHAAAAPALAPPAVVVPAERRPAPEPPVTGDTGAVTTDLPRRVPAAPVDIPLVDTPPVDTPRTPLVDTPPVDTPRARRVDTPPVETPHTPRVDASSVAEPEPFDTRPVSAVPWAQVQAGAADPNAVAERATSTPGRAPDTETPVGAETAGAAEADVADLTLGGAVDDFLPHSAQSGALRRRARRAPRPPRGTRAPWARRRRDADDNGDDWLTADALHDEHEGLSWLVGEEPPASTLMPAPADPETRPAGPPVERTAPPGLPKRGDGEGNAAESTEHEVEGDRITSAGLPRRQPGLPGRQPAPVVAPPQQQDDTPPPNRAPEQVLELLARFEAGRRRGSVDAHTDAETDESGLTHVREER